MIGYTDLMETFEVIVVGGGPAGLMAAVAARTQGARVALIEKGDKLGRKLGISGGGRCNVTNAKPMDELVRNIPGNGRFVQSALAQFDNMAIIRFFEGLGIRVKEEDRGRVFPVSDKASTVVQALVNYVYELGVTVYLTEPVRELRSDGHAVTGVLTARGRDYRSGALVLATGGCSVPKTGSTGDAYPWAESLGHTLVEPYPTEVPLTSTARVIRNRSLQGLSLRSVDVTVWLERSDKEKRLTTENGDLIFTHFGLSGPVALRCSHYVSTAKRKDPDAVLRVDIDCLPHLTQGELELRLIDARQTVPRKHFRTTLEEWLPERLVAAVLEAASVDGSQQMANVKNADVAVVTQILKAFPVPITGTLPLEQATVTGGGVSVKDIDPRTMASKRSAGLYFAGELMDVHAHTGGYNITVAFSTGHLAGQSAAEYALALAEGSRS